MDNAVIWKDPVVLVVGAACSRDRFISRLRLLAESYRETEAEPMIIRRAKAFHRILAEIPVTIENWQKVVGNYAGKPLMTSIYPEYTAGWILEEMDDPATRKISAPSTNLKMPQRSK